MAYIINEGENIVEEKSNVSFHEVFTFYFINIIFTMTNVNNLSEIVLQCELQLVDCYRKCFDINNDIFLKENGKSLVSFSCLCGR